MVYLEFEKTLEDLQEQLDKQQEIGEKSGVDVSATIAGIEDKIKKETKRIYSNLSPWQRVQVSRHPDRPYTLHYIDKIFDNFIELHGDRNVADDKAIVGGLASIDGQSVMVIGHQKGIPQIFGHTHTTQPSHSGRPVPNMSNGRIYPLRLILGVGLEHFLTDPNGFG